MDQPAHLIITDLTAQSHDVIAFVRDWPKAHVLRWLESHGQVAHVMTFPADDVFFPGCKIYHHISHHQQRGLFHFDLDDRLMIWREPYADLLFYQL
jgi:hypothetical protein